MNPYETNTANMLLKAYREKSRKSQAAVSIALGLSDPQFISNVERGVARVPKAAIQPWCECISLPIPKLIKALITDYKTSLLSHIQVH